jgi:indolepyruvate ferredoxin oxidoreductase beta subunit
MKTDIVLAGVGGQGVLSIAAIIAEAASQEGLKVRQSEVHGMAQRGGAVLAHLRISDKEIHGYLVPKGSADLVISMEPLESLRYVGWLSPEGAVVTAAEPFLNIPNYPDMADLKSWIGKLPKARVVEAAALAKETGLPRAVNMVMVGAASHFIPVKPETLEKTIKSRFATKQPEANVKAFEAGRA